MPELDSGGKSNKWADICSDGDDEANQGNTEANLVEIIEAELRSHIAVKDYVKARHICFDELSKLTGKDAAADYFHQSLCEWCECTSEECWATKGGGHRGVSTPPTHKGKDKKGKGGKRRQC